ncbi:YrhC family protein [Bacillus sp. Marseille-P3661]|uniref:YrhC family protein n=1 Tax=Bacillus sp. Marseille-P3661 TaxID=1936234 RepID=UPI0015E19FB8|nr:YrhC family protein [Bacillus sp. Marseille-P3661]
MTSTTIKEIKSKIKDYHTFATTLLVFSVFLYLSVIIPHEGITDNQLTVLMGITVAFLTGSFYFFTKEKILRNKIEDQE